MIIVLVCKLVRTPYRMIAKVRNFLKIGKIDVIHLTSIFTPANLFHIYFAKKYKVPVVISPRGELLQGAVNRSLKTVINNSNLIFHSTGSEETASIKKFFPFSEVIEIPNYLCLDKPLDIPVKKQILFLGRLDTKKI